jgi:hypothetical protein
MDFDGELMFLLHERDCCVDPYFYILTVILLELFNGMGTPIVSVK